MIVHRTSTAFRASLKRVILLHLSLPGVDRIKHITQRVLALSEEEADELLHQAYTNFAHRHRNLSEKFLKNYRKTIKLLGQAPEPEISKNRKILIGSFFTKEYSTQSAALFNPSIVPHPDQNGLNSGDLRFVMSLRATGEGHISSVEFRTGVLTKSGDINLDDLASHASCSERFAAKLYSKVFVQEKIKYFQNTNIALLELLPESFTAQEADDILKNNSINYDFYAQTQNAILEILDSNYDIVTDPNIPLSEKVIFPNSKCESMGIEDVRLVKFQDGDFTKYYGTYTAYDGKNIRTQLIETFDFIKFNVRTLYGDAIKDKGMALFPEKINGKYAMITRQGGEKINISFSEKPYQWDNYQLLVSPKYPWEFVQLGNCGSPIKTEHGWLLLTHAVGYMRRYVKSAILLDLNDPTKVIARLDKPIIEPLESEREGYVPNVVYTCGWLAHHDKIFIPYAMSDTACGMIWVSQRELLDELLKNV